jgi:hypothetical protein
VPVALISGLKSNKYLDGQTRYVETGDDSRKVSSLYAVE